MMPTEIQIQSKQAEQLLSMLRKEQEKKEIALTELKDLRQQFCQNRDVITKMSASVSKISESQRERFDLKQKCSAAEKENDRCWNTVNTTKRHRKGLGTSIIGLL